VLGLALGRPRAVFPLFGVKGTIELAVDVSASMTAKDTAPSRIAALRRVAKDFVARHADDFRIGLVAFGGNVATVVSPTTQRQELYTALDELAIQRGTAVGSGIAAALALIFPGAGIDSRAALGERAATAKPEKAAGQTQDEPQRTAASYAQAAIVLLSDGQSGAGTDPLEAARFAADFGVRVHAIGVGTLEGETLRLDGWSMRVRLDEAALKDIAATTRGTYIRASPAIDWSPISGPMRANAALEPTYTEMTAFLAAAGALAAIAGAFVSLLRNRRIL
jgi:Ca-activated chloride channel homolog